MLTDRELVEKIDNSGEDADKMTGEVIEDWRVSDNGRGKLVLEGLWVLLQATEDADEFKIKNSLTLQIFLLVFKI